jgi:hypothetical protein
MKTFRIDRTNWRPAWVRTFILTLIFVLALPCGVGADSAAAEYSVKAAFLFHFAQFVEWPREAFTDAGAPLTYCTVGQDPFQGTLDASLSGKTVDGRALRVLHLKTAQDVQGCHVVYLGAAEKKSIPTTLASLKGKPVLTVGETEQFVADGGMIGFSLEGNKIRFEINLDAAEKAKLKISSRLLSLAKKVVGAQGEN